MRWHANTRGWLLSVVGLLAAGLVVSPVLLFGNDLRALVSMTLLAFVATVSIVGVLLSFIGRATLHAVAMVVIFVASASLLFEASNEIRTRVRWLVESSEYKAKVLASFSERHELKHAEWDGWGFVDNTVVYLVFDPDDALAQDTQAGHAPSNRGLPCEVFRIERMESQWFIATFFTDTDWDRCPR